MYPTPDAEGHYWAKWKIASPETPPDMLGTGDKWEVVQVWDNNYAKEPFRVSVPGVEQSQEIDAFYWGPKVEPPQPEPDPDTVNGTQYRLNVTKDGIGTTFWWRNGPLAGTEVTIRYLGKTYTASVRKRVPVFVPGGGYSAYDYEAFAIGYGE